LTAHARTALDTAALAARDPAVAVLDWVQSSGNATREELVLGIERMKDWPRTIGLHHKLRLSSGLAESVLETMAALFMRDNRIPMFEPQWSVFHPSGKLAGRVDGVWHRFKKMLELDSVMKYLKYRRPGESIEQCVIREKKREDLLRRLTGYGMIRLMKSDFDRGDATARMLLRELEPPAA
jgi:hypothetical protein